YTMGSEGFELEVGTKYGIKQMLNDGFFELTSGNTNCSLITATYTANVTINPSGLSLLNTFYTGTTLNDVPNNTLWFFTIKSMLESVSGVTKVIINEATNQFIIETTDGENSLNSQQVLVELTIVYDIICET
ncbi:MAG: hypothetical protein ACO3UU_12055, partial [Minisyncoccia bacterium]